MRLSITLLALLFATSDAAGLRSGSGQLSVDHLRVRDRMIDYFGDSRCKTLTNQNRQTIQCSQGKFQVTLVSRFQGAKLVPNNLEACQGRQCKTYNLAGNAQVRTVLAEVFPDYEERTRTEYYTILADAMIYFDGNCELATNQRDNRIVFCQDKQQTVRFVSARNQNGPLPIQLEQCTRRNNNNQRPSCKVHKLGHDVDTGKVLSTVFPTTQRTHLGYRDVVEAMMFHYRRKCKVLKPGGGRRVFECQDGRAQESGRLTVDNVNSQATLVRFRKCLPKNNGKENCRTYHFNQFRDTDAFIASVFPEI